MISQKYSDIYNSELAENAILNEQMYGFKEDYLVVHILIKTFGKKIKTFFEIGTHLGTGLKVIKNAVGNECKVYSLDLPLTLSHLSDNFPFTESGEGRTGIECNLPYIQLWGDSMVFDYSEYYPIDAWFIDGAHDSIHVLHDSKEAIKSGARLIIWHDADAIEVYNAITESLDKNIEYTLYRVVDTRIAYAIKNE